MKIYPEIKKIAGKNDAIRRLGEKLERKLDVDGLCLDQAYFVTGCTEQSGSVNIPFGKPRLFDASHVDCFTSRLWAIGAM